MIWTFSTFSITFQDWHLLTKSGFRTPTAASEAQNQRAQPLSTREFVPAYMSFNFPCGASDNPPANAGKCKRCGFNLWVGKILWRRAWQPIPVLLPGESHGQRSLVSYSPQGCKEPDMTEVI